MALTADRDTPLRDGLRRSLPIAASVKCYAGGIAVVDTSGYVRPGRADATDRAVGRFEATVDNTGGSAGDESVEVLRGVFRYKNSASADAITRADIGATCFIVDDETVAKTSNSGARSAAGPVFDVDADGVWVALGPSDALTLEDFEGRITTLESA